MRTFQLVVLWAPFTMALVFVRIFKGVVVLVHNFYVFFFFLRAFQVPLVFVRRVYVVFLCTYFRLSFLCTPFTMRLLLFCARISAECGFVFTSCGGFCFCAHLLRCLLFLCTHFRLLPFCAHLWRWFLFCDSLSCVAVFVLNLEQGQALTHSSLGHSVSTNNGDVEAATRAAPPRALPRVRVPNGLSGDAERIPRMPKHAHHRVLRTVHTLQNIDIV